MRRAQSIEYQIDVRRNLLQTARAAARDQLRDGAAFGQLHRVPGKSCPAVPVVDRDDRRMRQLGSEPSLLPECTDRLGVSRDVGMQDLESNLALERQVARTPDSSKAAAAQLGQDLVVVADGVTHRALVGVLGNHDLSLA